MKHGFGALPPPDFVWQIGKTAGSLITVNNIVIYLKTCTREKERIILERVMAEVKSGQRVYTTAPSAKEVLAEELKKK